MNILEMDLGPLAPEHPIEIIVGVILVLLLTWLIAKAVVPRFEKLYEERTETIQGGIERAERAQAEAKAALEKYQAQLASARDEAAQIRDDAKSQGAQIIAEMRANAQEEADRITGSEMCIRDSSNPGRARSGGARGACRDRRPCDHPGQSDRGGVPTRRPARPGDRRPLPLIARRRALGV